MIIHGNSSIRRFFISQSAILNTPELLSNYDNLIKRYLSRPIDDERGESETIGWTNPFDIINGSTTFADLDIGSGQVVLGFRKEKKTVPGVLFKAKLKDRIEQTKREKGLERLTRQHRMVIAETLKAELLKETSAKTSLVDAVWLRNNDAFYVGVAGNAADNVAQLQEATFGTVATRGLPAVLVMKNTTALEATGIRISGASDAVNAFADYGLDFLTWLLIHAGEDLNEIVAKTSPTSSGVDIQFVDRIALVSKSDEHERLQIYTEDCANAEVMRRVRRKGWRVHGAKITLTVDSLTWQTSIDHTFDLRGMKLPIDKLPDERDQAAVRIDSIQRFFEVLDTLFNVFLTIRTSEADWTAELATWRETGAGLEDLNVEVTFTPGNVPVSD